jgi:hypothetical protein
LFAFAESAQDIAETVQNVVRSRFEVDRRELQDVMIEPEETIPSMEAFLKRNSEYALELERRATLAVRSFPPGLKHHTIHIISNTINLPSTIGMSFMQFLELFEL